MTSCAGAGGTGTLYSYAQLEGLWINAGGSKAVAPIAAAIALAESGGCSAALNANDTNGEGGTQSSWGLWQISNGTHSQPVPGILTPATNAQQAVAKYQGDNNTFGDWGTYSSGAYKQYISNSTTPDTSVSSPASATLDSSTTAGGDCAITMPNIDLGVTSIGGSCLVTYSTERALIAGLMLGVAGIVALAGLVILAAAGFGSTGAGRVVEAVTPVGRVVSAVTPKRS
jgi:hypothetical protein